MVASLEERRAAVERLLDAMAAENERRRDWWREPPKGWREGRLELRSALFQRGDDYSLQAEGDKS